MQLILKGRVFVKGKAEGEALVSKTPISFLLGINTNNGVIIEQGHEHEGKSIAGKILVYPFGKGSSGDCLRLWRCAKNKVAPVALICDRVEPVHLQGALITGIPMVCEFDKDPVITIKTGDYVKVYNNLVIVHRK